MFDAAALTPDALANVPLDALDDEAELAMVRRLVQWPRVVEGAAQAREPHRIAFFLYDLAGDFHMLWNRGRDESILRFIQEGTGPARWPGWRWSRAWQSSSARALPSWG